LKTWIDTTSSTWNKYITVRNDDSFHPASEVFPYHHPEIDHSCAANVTAPCETVHVSCSENAYNIFDNLKVAK